MLVSSLLAVGALIGLPRVAMADEGAVALTLSAPEGCPPRDVLIQRARQRAEWIHFTDANDAGALTVEVAITRRARRWDATIVLAGTGEGRDERALTAGTCAELFDASGLVIALLVRAKASAGPEEASAPPVALTSGAPPLEAAPPPPDVPAPDRIDVPSTPPRAWSPFVGAAMQGEVAVLPATATGGALFAGLERSAGLVSPSLRLEASLTTSDLAAGPSRAGSFVRGVARADVCPLRIALSGALSLRPCVWAGMGAVHAAGAAVPKSLSETDLWADVGALLRARAELHHAFVELDAGAVVPLTRPVFLLENPRSVVYATPPAGAIVAFGGGVRFL